MHVYTYIPGTNIHIIAGTAAKCYLVFACVFTTANNTLKIGSPGRLGCCLQNVGAVSKSERKWAFSFFYQHCLGSKRHVLCGKRLAWWYERFGSIRLGSVGFGWVRFGSGRFDSIRFHSVRLGSVRLGSVRFDSARFVSVRFVFGSVRFGSVRPGPARFGSVRSDSVKVVSS